MNRFKKSIGVIALLGILMYACAPDHVRPSSNEDAQVPKLAGSEGEHPSLDTICRFSDSLFMVRADDGSEYVNKCYARAYPGGPLTQVTCPPGQLRWGSLTLREGYYQNTDYIDCDFSLAPGWFCDFNNWEFGIASQFTFDNNGIPIVTTDWGSTVINPAQNKWKLRLEVGTLPSPCFDVALRVHALRLSLFGATPIPGSETELWGMNPNWNNVQSPSHSTSRFLLHFCPARCLDLPPLVESCKTFYTGVSELGNCTTITPDVSNLTGNLTYLWSTGETTQSISVCPTQTTRYDVTISSNGTPVRRNQILVYYVNVSCGNGNGNNGIHKVTVCHLPHGNPTNQQNICIDWSGVPAHVARFRAPGSNPRQGHDSGCEIGTCGSNPCL